MHTDIEAMISPVYRLTRDVTKALRQAGGGMTDTEARYLTDIYYTMQDQRVAVNNMVKGLERDAKKTETAEEPHEALDLILKQFATLEENVAKLLAIYTQLHPMAWFFDQTIGIGPVLAAGLLAHIDIRKAPTAGHIYSFAGLNPETTWAKGQKRPFNADLKKLCWKIGDSFVKFSGHESGYYGKVYRERKAVEWRNNLSGKFADQARNKLDTVKIGKDTDARAWYSGACSAEKARECLESGKTPTAADCKTDQGQPMLPPAHIDMRARRYAVKLFLSHLQECWYREVYACAPPAPYAIAQGGHAHYIPPPQKAPVREG